MCVTFFIDDIDVTGKSTFQPSETSIRRLRGYEIRINKDKQFLFLKKLNVVCIVLIKKVFLKRNAKQIERKLHLVLAPVLSSYGISVVLHKCCRITWRNTLIFLSRTLTKCRVKI